MRAAPIGGAKVNITSTGGARDFLSTAPFSYGGFPAQFLLRSLLNAAMSIGWSRRIALLGDSRRQHGPRKLRTELTHGIVVGHSREPAASSVARDHLGDLMTGGRHAVTIADRCEFALLGKRRARQMLRFRIFRPAL